MSVRARARAVADAACLAALLDGADRLSRIAVAAGLDLPSTGRALARLEARGLVVATANGRSGRRTWRAAPGAATGLDAATAEGAPGRIAPPSGPAALRLMNALDRPRSLTELSAELGLSRQRVSQLLVRFIAQGILRTADPLNPTRVVARADFADVLLPNAAARVLSALPDDGATTATRLRAVRNVASGSVDGALDRLVASGLAVAEAGPVSAAGLPGPLSYRLTPAGSRHPQRAATVRRAESGRLPVSSPRVQAVLARMADIGPARSCDLARELGIEAHSANALMQYLKRRGLAMKSGPDAKSPHALTEAGLKLRAEFRRRELAGDPARPAPGVVEPGRRRGPPLRP